MIAVFALLRWAPGLLAPTDGLTGPDKAEALDRARTSVLAVLAGLIAVVGAIYTHRSYLLNREIHTTTANLTREGQITERFTRAVDQLGHASVDIRLGGIYALERIARESAVDHGPIMEIITAWIREHAAPPRPPFSSGRTTSTRSMDAVRRRQRGILATDVQAAVKVLGRRNIEHDNGEWRVDLAGTSLVGADFSGANLTWACFHGADLSYASFASAKLEHADLSHACLDHADLRSTRLNHADLRGTDLRHALFQGVNVSLAMYDAHTRSDVELGTFFTKEPLRFMHDESEVEDGDLKLFFDQREVEPASGSHLGLGETQAPIAADSRAEAASDSPD